MGVTYYNIYYYMYNITSEIRISFIHHLCARKQGIQLKNFELKYKICIYIEGDISDLA